MVHRFLRVFVSLALCASFFGCASNSNFHTARPLGKNGFGGFVAISHVQTESDTIPIIEKVPEFNFFEIGADYGVTSKLDVGIKYTAPLSGSLLAKYTLLGDGDKGFFFAPGLRVGYTDMGTIEDTIDIKRIEFAVPLFVSIYPADWLGITLIPTYSGRFYTTGGDFQNIVGGNANIRIGRKVGVVIEGAYHRNLYWDWSEIQFGASVNLQFRKKSKNKVVSVPEPVVDAPVPEPVEPPPPAVQ